MKVALSLMAVCTLLGCKDPAAEVQPAKIEEADKAAPQGDGKIIETLTISPENSTIAFQGSKMTRAHEGGFSDFDGKVRLAEPLERSQVELTIQTASLFSDDEKLTKHLKSPDFFDVAKFPTATFKSTRMEDTPLGTKVFGELTLHGQTKPIAFIAGIDLTDERFASSTSFSLNRQDFGISYPGMPDDLIRDKVVIEIKLNLPRRGS